MENEEKRITYRDYSDSDAEICRDLCNALMQHQARVCTMHRDILGAMNFDNRLKPTFDGTKEKLLLAAMDGERPVGYVFAVTEPVSRERRESHPFRDKIRWRPGYTGFIPADVEEGAYVGEIGNLFVDPEYRSLHIGRTLMNRAMDWIKGHEGLQCILVYVSNGNNAGSFYEKYGFRYANDVTDGIIKAYELKL